MKRIAITVGIGSDWQGKPLSAEVIAQAKALVRDHLANVYGGYTEERVHGGWVKGGAEPVVIEESGLKFIVIARLSWRESEELARMIGCWFEQRAVMLEIEQLVEGSGVVVTC